MKVKVKDFSVDMEIKNSGIELEVREPGEEGAHLGDLVVTKTGLIWCKGRTRPENGIRISWADFAKEIESRE